MKHQERPHGTKILSGIKWITCFFTTSKDELREFVSPGFLELKQLLQLSKWVRLARDQNLSVSIESLNTLRKSEIFKKPFLKKQVSRCVFQKKKK